MINSSDKEWVIAAALNGEYFNGPRELRVPAGRTKSYILGFNPTWVCDVSGQLVLRNNETQEKYTYSLRGKAEEPLAENTIPVECKARETRKITINVPNITFDEIVYQVETDLLFVSGEPKITVGKMEVGKYVLHINPQVSGKTTGSVTFIAPNKQYVWFVVQINVLRPPAEDTISIQAEVRKGAVAEIAIANPTGKTVDFMVRRKGDGLHGDDIITVEPNQSSTYQLAFAPVRSGVVDGIISFNNDDIGEFWYRLNLIAKDAAPQQLNFQSEIGKSSTTEVLIDNPLDLECTMTVTNSNEVNYSVMPQHLVLKPSSSTKVFITYIPSAIQSGQEAHIKIFHSAAGLWEFKCRGTGLPPTRMETVHCIAQVGRMSSVSVNFRNPFPTPKRFLVSLKTPDPAIFSLMGKKQSSSLGPFQTMQIAVAYAPQQIAAHKALVVVQLLDHQDSELIWEFPLSGIAEYTSGDPVIRLNCKSRKSVSQILKFSLGGYDGDATTEEFDTELFVAKDVQYGRAAVNSMTIARLHSDDTTSTVSFQCTFAPLRPFIAHAELLVKKKTGGMWRFPIQLESQSPDIDDVIVMEAAVNAAATINFQLYNVLPQQSSFIAYFSSDSPQEFTVTPSKGVLPPMPMSQSTRGAGTTISVGFTSSQYGKTLSGILIVDTDDMQWRYEVRGTLPKYQPPTNVSSKVQNRLRPEIESALRHHINGK